jgi:hypothetical protein
MVAAVVQAAAMNARTTRTVSAVLKLWASHAIRETSAGALR